jgi:ubiquinone/menaquinone biosynthesis C-methylase UbiE
MQPANRGIDLQGRQGYHNCINRGLCCSALFRTRRRNHPAEREANETLKSDPWRERLASKIISPGYVSFDRVANLYEATRMVPANTLDRVAQIIREDARLNSSDPFLDAGVGTGRFSRHLHRNGIGVIGVDISRAMLEQARSIQEGFPLIQANLYRLPFASRSFRGVLMVHILHLLEGWKTAVDEARRVLQDGAPLYLGYETGRRNPVQDIYFELATQKGIRRKHIGADSKEEVFDYVRSLDGSVIRIDGGALQWEIEIENSRLLSLLDLNPFSQCWNAPESEHAKLMVELKKQMEEKGLATPVQRICGDFSLWRVSFQSAKKSGAK